MSIINYAVPPSQLDRREYQLFMELLELSPEEQRAQIAARCHDSPTLAKRLLSLLEMDAVEESRSDRCENCICWPCAEIRRSGWDDSLKE